jgi:ABC-type sulfate/molybdate transport systems ATPase subunit
MISGGEKKRVNIGSEPLTDPAIVFLNEPTSGLDSTSAVALMRILHDLARDEGKTIITSIHQPSSVVFFAFDALMLLADGKVVYLGTPNGSLEYVRDMGLECPRGTIPRITTWICSWWMARSRTTTTTTTTTTTMTAATGTTEKEKAIRRGGGWRTTAAAPLQRRRTGGGTTTKRLLIDSWDAKASAKRIKDEDAAERAMRFDGSGSAAGGVSAPGDGGGTFVARVHTGEHHCHPLCTL